METKCQESVQKINDEYEDIPTDTVIDRLGSCRHFLPPTHSTRAIATFHNLKKIWGDC